ncbi:uncharacterized methyltransferase At2g41040, chloroplastic-like isoform X1 [Durio zibethinus]|uniref:Uncharacterized methyltransferase At2g41040, chloroplastic-like isoform X1 n=1 Tax=Durio zibethinus TaxID=66656 RepID=A0A6P5ZH41_DURZI|nr:uncharacterized methyltransferase At2g41040, chloroplastic-like isoform X1 [Durio zibethinus]
MAVASPCLLHHLHKSLLLKDPSFSRNLRFRPSLHFSSQPFRFTVRATSAVALEPDLSTQQNQTVETDLFSCPVCYEPLIRKGSPGLNLEAIYRSGFKCKKCNKSYSSKDVYLDLTITAGLRNYSEVKPFRTELFRSPFVSFVYERGWRQIFNLSGFPGPDEEFRMAQEFFKPAEGGILVDVSCGSGLFSRKFAKSGTYSGVIALDFSENMLRQCNDFIKQDESILPSNIALVRADVSRLPFSSGAIDAVHAAAALHCWSSPSNAVSIFLLFSCAILLTHWLADLPKCSWFDDTDRTHQIHKLHLFFSSYCPFLGKIFLESISGSNLDKRNMHLVIHFSHRLTYGKFSQRRA